MPAVVEEKLEATPRAPQEARKLLGALELDPDVRSSVELIISELVSNSVLHGEGRPGRELELKVRCDSDIVHGEVCDDAQAFEWEPHEPDLTEPGGLGLMIVDNLADRWGVHKNGFACVWFECASCLPG